MIRAPLFVPASRPDRFAKAAASGADAIILDLEDGVAEADRASARAAIRRDFTDLPVMVRINAIGTSWHIEDLLAAKAYGAAAIMLPKAEDPALVTAVATALDGRTPIIALIETARGLAAARALAACPEVNRLAFGSLDFCADMGMAHDSSTLLPARSELVLASRLAGIAPPLDGVTTRIDSPDVAAADAAHARALGMGGKLCIHPAQIAPVLRAFRHGRREVEWAQRVLSVGDGAVRVGDSMVDEPVRRRARAILSEVDATFRKAEN